MTESNKWLLILAAVLMAWLVSLLAPVLMPFAMAAILAYMADPLVDRLEARKAPRTLGVVIVFVGLTLTALLVLMILLPMIERQFVLLAEKLPGYVDWFQKHVWPLISAQLGLEGDGLQLEALKSSLQAYWQTAGGVAARVVAYVSRSGLVLAGWVANVVLVLVVSFYLLRDWDVLVARVHELLPRRSEAVIGRLAKESDEVLGAFLRGQLLVMLALAMIYAAGLFFIGLDLALIIGMIAGLVSFVPYLGFIVGITIAGIAAVMQFHDFIHLLYVVGVFGVGQMIEGMLLTPLLVGDRIGLHPVAVIFAVLAGGQLFGFLGVLLALPVAAVVAVVLRYLHERYKNSALYATAGEESGEAQ